MIAPRRVLVYAGTVAFVLALWALLAGTGAVEPLLLPPIGDVWRALSDLAAEPSKLLEPVGTTLEETAIAFGIAAVVALPVGVLVGSSRLLRRAYEPVLTGLNALPLVILYPVLAATLGVGSHSKIALGTLYAFFPIAIAAARATATVDGRLITAAQTMGATRAQWLTGVVLPAVLGPVLAAMRVSLGLALVTVIASEFIAGAAGIGYQLGTASQSLDSPGLFAWIVIACLVTVAVNLLFSLTTHMLQKGVTR
ncbi:ABC transporter permease [Actinomadura opuntiae]|uniref:ABC transporter permease n=1 Tax=Actinomadura sp. OS1-43 TaxID=604315 RepID=UPI00255A9147|nr:ABC transporter permease subunit [Actinomadura sp. OS1-43]MDL4813653.1 ABC transporter permease subunit [Actinomadura sp. OS1-43]